MLKKWSSRARELVFNDSLEHTSKIFLNIGSCGSKRNPNALGRIFSKEGLLQLSFLNRALPIGSNKQVRKSC